MNTKSLIIIGLCAAIPMAAFAGKMNSAEPALQQTEAGDEDNNVITEECLTNVSLFHESAKNKQYADAWEPWSAAYKECPAASVNIYIDGDKIVEWKLSQTKSGTPEYDQYRALLLTLHDKRIKYFGNDPKYNYVVHAELNAILNARGKNLKGARLYVDLFPCNECAKAIIQSGIAEVVYVYNKYADSAATAASTMMFNSAGVKLTRFTPHADKIVLDFKANE